VPKRFIPFSVSSGYFDHYNSLPNSKLIAKACKIIDIFTMN